MFGPSRPRCMSLATMARPSSVRAAPTAKLLLPAAPSSASGPNIAASHLSARAGVGDAALTGEGVGGAAHEGPAGRLDAAAAPGRRSPETSRAGARAT